MTEQITAGLDTKVCDNCGCTFDRPGCMSVPGIRNLVHFTDAGGTARAERIKALSIAAEHLEAWQGGESLATAELRRAASALQRQAAQPRVVVLAGDKRSGYMEARALGIEPVAVVTPRSPRSARGMTADRIMEASSITPEQRDRLMPQVLPCVATSAYGTRGSDV